MSLLENTMIHSMIPATTGTANIISAKILDMDGFDGVMWVGTIAGNTNTTGGYATLIHMHVVRTGAVGVLHKEPSTWQAVFTHGLVAEVNHGGVVFIHLLNMVHLTHHIDHGLGVQARHGRAADVVQRQPREIERRSNHPGFFFIRSGPSVVIG